MSPAVTTLWPPIHDMGRQRFSKSMWAPVTPT